jgi:hypothetical protein
MEREQRIVVQAQPPRDTLPDDRTIEHPVPGELVIKPQSTLEQIVWIDSTLAKVGTKTRNEAPPRKTAISQGLVLLKETGAGGRD